MAEDGPGFTKARTPDEEIEPESRRLIESVEDKLGFEHGGWAPEWSERDAHGPRFPEEAQSPEARSVAADVLDRMMATFQYPYLRRGHELDPLTVWQSYDASRNTVNVAAKDIGKKPAEIRLRNVLGAAKQAEAYFHRLNDFFEDERHAPDVRDYQLMQRCISQALKPQDLPTPSSPHAEP